MNRNFQPGAASVALTAWELRTPCDPSRLTGPQLEEYSELLRAVVAEKEAFRAQEAAQARRWEQRPAKPIERLNEYRAQLRQHRISQQNTTTQTK